MFTVTPWEPWASPFFKNNVSKPLEKSDSLDRPLTNFLLRKSSLGELHFQATIPLGLVKTLETDSMVLSCLLKIFSMVLFVKNVLIPNVGQASF